MYRFKVGFVFNYEESIKYKAIALEKVSKRVKIYKYIETEQI